MLTRAVSAPAHYGPAGILRYTAESLPSTHSGIKFAPLPETEVFGRRAKFSSKLGVNGRSSILNKQRRNPNGINYDPKEAIEETNEPPSNGDAASPNQNDGSTLQQASKTSTLKPPEVNSSLNLRRSSSEDGTMSTSSKRVNSLKFWKKPSKRPSLSTIPSNTVIDIPSVPLLPIANPVPLAETSRSIAPVDNVTGVSTSVELKELPQSVQIMEKGPKTDFDLNPPLPPSPSTEAASTTVSTPSSEIPTPLAIMVDGTSTDGFPEMTESDKGLSNNTISKDVETPLITEDIPNDRLASR